MTGVNTSSAVLLALVSALVLAVLHLAAPRIRKLPLVPEQVTASFAGGIAVSYVFLHLLPELTEGNERLSEVLGDQSGRTPLLGLEIFLVAPIGFTVYNGVIGYTLPLNWRASSVFAVVFTAAIGLHFVLTDRGLEEHYGTRFDRWPPRLLLAGALLGGWGLAALVAPTSGTAVSLLTAFLAGSIVLNVFKQEIPSTRRSHFGWFVIGVVLYAALPAGATLVSEPAEPEHGEEAGAWRSSTPVPGLAAESERFRGCRVG